MRVASRVLLSLGTVAAHVLVSFRIASGPSSAPSVATIPVVVATRDLAEGDRLGGENVAVAQWPVGTVPKGAYSSIEQLAGRAAGLAVFKGEAITLRRLAGGDSRPTSYPKITPGKRAMSFRVAEVSGLAGIVQPNNRVDLILVVDRGEKGPMARLFMENMRVLWIGSVPTQYADRTRIEPAWIATIDVTPAEAERLAIGMRQGEIHLTLRAPAEIDPRLSVATTVRVEPWRKAQVRTLPQPRVAERVSITTGVIRTEVIRR